MISKRFCTILMITEIVLFLLLAYFVMKTRKAITDIDADSIKKHFKYVEYLSYVLLVLVYSHFVIRMFSDPKDRQSKYVHHFSPLKMILWL